ncbi:GNAT family N-acetyltransferase [Sorangium sp. So ce693]|uniref:GNAT family N-acetyltransferase n=1 Tax=Sorangium sp. So ce693 TaxID=3133318 RepID=UPI003F5F21D6
MARLGSLSLPHIPSRRLARFRPASAGSRLLRSCATSAAISDSAGLGRWLIRGLVELGVQELGVGECSLFVAADNTPAIRLYRRLGFVEARYPEDDASVTSLVYMVVLAGRLTELGLCAEQCAASDAQNART